MKEGTLSMMLIVFFLALRSARRRATILFASASFFLFYDIYACCVVFSIRGFLQEFLREDSPLQGEMYNTWNSACCMPFFFFNCTHLSILSTYQ